MTDIHSHILPGLDDGSKSMEMSVELIKGLISAGYDDLWVTPHISADSYPNTRDSILRTLDCVCEVLVEVGISVNLNAAAEYMIDSYFISELLPKRELLTINNQYLLIEFPFMQKPMAIKELIFDIQLKGYTPILAHPERYQYLYDEPDFYDELKHTGILFQCNLFSFAGLYGRSAQKVAAKLYKKGLIDLIGTDIHHPDQLEYFDYKQTKKILTSNVVINNLP